MKIAVLSDIHGDFDKLKMILDQIQGADKLVLLGDLDVGGDFLSLAGHSQIRKSWNP